MQNQMFTIVQDVQKKVDEIYKDWKAIGFGSKGENDMKWIDVSINVLIVCLLVVYFYFCYIK